MGVYKVFTGMPRGIVFSAVGFRCMGFSEILGMRASCVRPTRHRSNSPKPYR